MSAVRRKSLKIVRAGDRNILLVKPSPPDLVSLYAEVIAVDADFESRRRMPGEILFDTVCAVSAGSSLEEMTLRSARAVGNGLTRTAEVTGADGKTYQWTISYREDGGIPETALSRDGVPLR